MLNFWKKQGPEPVNLMNWICRDWGVRRLRLLNPLFRQQLCKWKLHAVPRLSVTRLRREHMYLRRRCKLILLGWEAAEICSEMFQAIWNGNNCSQARFCNAFFFLSVDASGPFKSKSLMPTWRQVSIIFLTRE